MRPRTAALLLLSIAGLLFIGIGLSVRLLRAGLRTASLSTEQRLRAIGITAGQALEQGALPTLLDSVARRNDLEAAYLLDAELQPVPVPGQSPVTVSLLRIDPDRALRALHGAAAVGPAYHLEELGPNDEPTASWMAFGHPGPDAGTVLAGYFPVVAAGKPARLLVLEAGPAFGALPAQLRATAWAAGATAFGSATLCALLVIAALRAGAREQQLRVEAERGRALREMSAMVAHEVRNPLGTIRAGAELLREQTGPSELIEDILAEVGRLSTLTNQFLQFSSEPKLCIAELDLGKLCDELCARLRREHPDEAQLLIKREGDATVLAQGDVDSLRQVLLNLALNAAQAMQALPGSHTLTLTARQLPNGGAEVRVQDTGPGISPEIQKSLFVPFRTTKATGTGLGLVISQRIVQRHGGTLTLLAQRKDEKGACFVVSLPKTPPLPKAAEASAEGSDS